MSTLRVDNILNSDGSPSSISKMVLETAKTATGTAIDFTGIPSWVKRVTVMFDGVSTNGSSLVVIQLGAGSITTSGYSSGYALAANSAATVAGRGTSFFYTSGNASAADLRCGQVTLQLVTGSRWIASGVVGTSAFDNVTMNYGVINLSGTLDRIRITTVNGTDTFDAGSINILYEG